MLANVPKYIAESISHEAGHSLGLSHDGTSKSAYYYGQGTQGSATGWAPIMGAGYYQNLVQWSKGEYLDANNKEDDLLIISSYLSYSPDDVPNTVSGAKRIPLGSTFSINGFIGKTGGVDIWSFQAGVGVLKISVNVSPASTSSNLDIRADLLSSTGAMILGAYPATVLSAAITYNATVQGVYYLRLYGIGLGSPTATGYTNYASLGQYYATGTVVLPK